LIRRRFCAKFPGTSVSKVSTEFNVNIRRRFCAKFPGTSVSKVSTEFNVNVILKTTPPTKPCGLKTARCLQLGTFEDFHSLIFSCGFLLLLFCFPIDLKV
jgi:hypothetical protein